MSQSGIAETAFDTSLPLSRDLARLRGFGPATLIETRRGLVPAIEVRAGDRLRTLDGTSVEVVWTDRLHLDAAFLRRTPQLRPVLLCEGDLGSAPIRNVVLSPEQFVWDETAPEGGAFRRAGDVTRHPAIFARRDVEVTYVSVLCAEPVVIEAEGRPTRNDHGASRSRASSSSPSASPCSSRSSSTSTIHRPD